MREGLEEGIEHYEVQWRESSAPVGPRHASAAVAWNDGKTYRVVLYVLALAAVVVGVDVLFFRHRFWERLMVNVGIVLVFAAFYLRFLRRA